MKRIKQRKERYSLSAETIDALALVCSEALLEADTDKKDIIRIRISLEEILSVLLSALGEGAACFCRTGSRFGRQFIEIRVKGEKIDLQEQDEPGLDEFMYGRLMAEAGLSLVYTYKDGANCLTVNPPGKARLSQMAQLSIAIAGAVICGLICTFLPEAAQDGLRSVTSPLFDTFLGALRAISSPLIFLAVCRGIISIGDLSTAGRIGKKVISRMCGFTFLIGFVILLLMVWLFPVAWESAAGNTNGFHDIYQMLLGIIPRDVVSPWLEGNALQIIFLGGCAGIAILVLGDRTSIVKSAIDQLGEMVKYLMGLISKGIPLFVFLSIFSLLASGMLNDLGGLLKAALLVLAGAVTVTAVYVAVLSAKMQVRLTVLVKKLLPTFLIGLTTASSAAAFATNLETCENKLGVSNRMVNFAIPLGQVIFKPTTMVGFLCISLCMAENNQVSMTPVWLITAVVVSGLLSIASPPIPGGALTCYTVLFAQLGIPATAVAVAIAIDSVLDFVITATALTCQQAEITLTAAKMGLVDRERLRSRGKSAEESGRAN